MEKLPHEEHALMGWFYNPSEDKVYDTALYCIYGTREEQNYFMNAIQRLNGFGYMEQIQDGCYYPFFCRLTERGAAYRRTWFPTKDERISDLQAQLDARSNAPLSDEEREFLRRDNSERYPNTFDEILLAQRLVARGLLEASNTIAGMHVYVPRYELTEQGYDAIDTVLHDEQ